MAGRGTRGRVASRGEEIIGDERSGWTSTSVGPARDTRWFNGGILGGAVTLEDGSEEAVRGIGGAQKSRRVCHHLSNRYGGGAIEVVICGWLPGAS